MSVWNGVSFLPPPLHLPTIEMTSDASGVWGCGAWHGNSWFQIPWDDRSSHLSIACKELIPIVLACAAWGHNCQGHQVICHCGNQVVVAGLRSRSCRDKAVMHLLRCLVFVEAHLGCYLRPEYINTRHNHLADDLSRNHLSSFLSKVPEADRQPTPTSSHLLDLLLNPQASTDLSSLAPSVQRYFQDGLAPSTQKTYAAALRCFHTFCLKFNVVSPFPVSEHFLCCFASFLADQGLAPQRLPFCYSEHANFAGPARPQRTVVTTTVEEGASWHQPGTCKKGHSCLHPAADNCSCAGANRQELSSGTQLTHTKCHYGPLPALPSLASSISESYCLSLLTGPIPQRVWCGETSLLTTEKIPQWYASTSKNQNVISLGEGLTSF